MAELDKATLAWVAEQEELMEVGKQMLRRASDDALEYVMDALENINDRQWRKMAMETQAVEMGIGVAMVDHLIPVIYRNMEKTMSKKLKVTKETARALRQIYIGRVVKTVLKELNERHQ